MEQKTLQDYMLLVLGMLPQVVSGVTGALEAMQFGHDRVEAMVADGNRNPTEAEWEELNTRTAALRTALHTD